MASPHTRDPDVKVKEAGHQNIKTMTVRVTKTYDVEVTTGHHTDALIQALSAVQPDNVSVAVEVVRIHI